MLRPHEADTRERPLGQQVVQNQTGSGGRGEARGLQPLGGGARSQPPAGGGRARIHSSKQAAAASGALADGPSSAWKSSIKKLVVPGASTRAATGLSSHLLSAFSSMAACARPEDGRKGAGLGLSIA